MYTDVYLDKEMAKLSGHPPADTGYLRNLPQRIRPAFCSPLLCSASQGLGTSCGKFSTDQHILFRGYILMATVM